MISNSALREAKKIDSQTAPRKELTDPEQLGGIVVFSSSAGVLLEWQQLFAGHLPPVQVIAKFVEEQVSKLNSDTWTSTKREKRDWVEAVQSDEVLRRDKKCLFNLTGRDTWLYETGKSEISYATPRIFLEHSEDLVSYYKLLREEGGDIIYFCEREVPGTAEKTEFIVAIEPKENRKERRTVVFTTEGAYRLLVPAYSVNPCQNISQRLWETKPTKVQQAPDTAKDKLQEYEDSEIKEETRCKFGILYLKAGQEDDENSQYSNDWGTPEYEKFLSLLGEKVDLNNLGGRYSGGLSGAGQSLYTKFENREIMFHVGTMILPDGEPEKQRVERKRHIGSDTINIVFKDPGYAYIVVEPEKKSGKEIKYRIGVAVNNMVPPFSPFVPSPAAFPHSEETRAWLLCKLINGSREIQYAPAPRKLREARRKVMIQEIIEPSSNTTATTTATPGGSSQQPKAINRGTSTMALASRLVKTDGREREEKEENRDRDAEKEKEKERMKWRQQNLKAKVERKVLTRNVAGSETIRLIITGEKLTDDIIRANKNWAEISQEIKQLTGREPEQIKLRSVVLTEKHVEFLNDLDILEVTLKQDDNPMRDSGTEHESK